MTTATFSGFVSGMDNTHRAEELHKVDRGGVTGSVRDIVNMDVTDTGELVRRGGYVLAAAGRAHSVWSNGPVTLAVLDGHLISLNAGEPTNLVHLSVGERRMYYVEVNGEVYYANGNVNGKFRSGVRFDWGVEQPLTAPVVASGVGTMTGAQYRFACTFFNKLGEESAPSRAVTYVVGAGGVSVTLPQAAGEVMGCNLYMTMPNSGMFYLVGPGTPGGTINIRNQPMLGRSLKNEFSIRTPPFGMMDYYNGRIYMASGNTLWFTLPMAYGLVDGMSGFITLPSYIKMLRAVEDGIFISDETDTYFIAGPGPEAFELRKILPFPAFHGSGNNVPKTTAVTWMSEKGVILGKKGGEIVITQDGRVVPSKAESGVTMTREEGGLTQHIGIGKAPRANPLAMGDYWKTEIIRRGTDGQ